MTSSIGPINATDLKLKNANSSKSYIQMTDGGAVELYYDNSEKLATTNTGIDVTGNVVVSGTVDGVDVATRDAILTSTTTTAGAALPKAGGAMTGAITTNSTFDGRDVADDGTKLDGIEALADVTDTTNVVSALTAGTGITISGGGTIAAGPIALTTVQTAANQTAHLDLTAQEGDIVVRSDENKTYCHNGGSAGTMADYTLLATPTDTVLSVAGNTGAVTTAQIKTALEDGIDSVHYVNNSIDTIHIANDQVTADKLANTAVTPASYGSGSAIPVITIDAQGRITAASTAATSSTLTIAADSGSDDAVTVGTDTLTFEGTTDEVSTTVSDNKITIGLADDKFMRKTNSTPTVGTNTAIDFDSTNCIITLDQNTTFTVSNASGDNIGATGTIVIKQNGTGGYSFTLPSVFKTPNGETITQVTTADSISALNYFIVDSNTILVNYLGDFS